MMRGDYGWWTTIGTRWADCDAYGQVNNVIYYSWFDTGVTRMLYERGVLGDGASAIGLGLESACQFQAPVEFPGDVEVGVAIGRLGTKSARYEVGVFPPGHEEPAATRHVTHVCVDRATRRPAATEPCHRDALADLIRAEITPGDTR